MGLPFDPRIAPEVLRERAVAQTEFVRRTIEILGTRWDGTTWTIRFRAPYSVPWVQVQVQSTLAGEGGVTYDPANFQSSTEVDCRAERVQEVAVTPIDAFERYAVFLIPVQYDGAGTKVLYDGEGGRPDDMSFITEWAW